MEEALYETTILRQFSGLHLDRFSDETTILNFRHLLEKHELAAGNLPLCTVTHSARSRASIRAKIQSWTSPSTQPTQRSPSETGFGNVFSAMYL